MELNYHPRLFKKLEQEFNFYMNDVKILSLFPEPIFKYKFENFKEFNIKLISYIYDLYKNDTKKIF